MTPAGPYAHGQSVTVRADGLVWAAYATVIQCAAGPVDPSHCDQGTERYVYLEDGDAAELTMRVLAVIDTTSGPVDCREVGACELVVVSASSLDPARTARVPLLFDPATEVVPPVLVVTPAEDLVHGQTITATGSGFTDDFLQFSQCAAVGDGPETCIWLPGFAEPSPAGTFTAEVRVSAFVPTPAGEVDCRDPDAPCVLVASSSRPDSSRAGRAPLRFDPDTPLPPPPSITVTPSTDLAEEAALTVAGTGFGGLDRSSVDLSVCQTGTARCDETVGSWIEPAADGTFTTAITVAASFRTWDGTVGGLPRRARAARSSRATGTTDGRSPPRIAFGDPPTMDDRYRLPVFDDVEVANDLVFRRTADASGAAVDLTLDVYEPAGDTVEERPVVVWLAGGWFGRGQARDMQPYAEAFARRGYVSVTMGYRARPGPGLLPHRRHRGRDRGGGRRHRRRGRGRALAARPRRRVRHRPRRHRRRRGAGRRGSRLRAGPRGERADRGGGARRRRRVRPARPGRARLPGAPRGAQHGGAAAPVRLGVRPRPVEGHDLQHGRVPRLVRGLRPRPSTVDRGRGRARSSPTWCWRRWATSSPRVATGVAPAIPQRRATPADRGPSTPWRRWCPARRSSARRRPMASGRLPVTGVELAHLVALALGLCLIGGAALASRRRGLRVIDRGSARVWVAAGTAVVLVVAGFAVTSALGPDDTDETAGGRAAEEQDDDATTGDVDHDSMDHDSMDHDSMDHDSMDHDGMNHTALEHAAVGHRGDDHTGAGHGHGDGLPATATSTPAGRPTPDHHHPGGSGGTGHDHPGGPSGSPDPGHEHPEPPDPETPVTGFDPSWTPAQVAYAEALIADTQEQLERYDNLAILPLTGYQWIKDGKDVDSYQHWIHLSRIIDSRRLDAAYPESLVLRTTADGPELEAAMYMLSTRYNLGNIPADIAWLPGWHIHDNLCFEKATSWWASP